MPGPTQGQVYDGYRYLGGDPKSEASWERAAPVSGPEAAGFTPLGGGWYRGPDGGSYQVGRGGAMVQRSEGTGSTEGAGSPKLTEDQGKSGGYARLMADAEASYRQALDEGFNPTGFTAGLANFTDNIPMMRGVGNFIRDDAGDRARQAELQWTDAQLKAMSGAASPEQEVARNNITFFARPGQNSDYLGDRLEQARGVAFESARLRGGPAAAGVSYPKSDAEVVGNVDPTTGLPTYPGVTRTNATDVAMPEGGYAQAEAEPIDLTSASREEIVAALRAGGTFRDGPDGQPYSLPPQEPQFGPAQDGDQARQTGVVVRPQTPEQAVTERDQMNPILRKVDGAVRGAADFLTFGMADEIAGAGDMLLGRGSYEQNVERQRAVDAADAEAIPVSRAAGQVAGGILPVAITGGAAAPAVGRSLLQRGVRGAGAGAAYGGSYGFGSGQGNVLDRAPSAAIGAGIGAVAGAAAPAVLNVAGRVASPVINALGDAFRLAARPAVNALGDMAPQALRTAVQPNDLARGVERFAGTNRPNMNALAATRAQLEGDVGRPVAAANIVNTGGRAALRGVATRSDGARAIAENFGQGTAEALPARVGAQSRRILSNDTRAPDDIRAALRTDRSNLARETYAEPYAQPVEIGEDISAALSGAPGRAAIQRARAAAEAWQDAPVMAELDAMEAAIRAGEPMPQVSAGAVDQIRQALSGRGEQLAQRPGTRAVGTGVQNRAGQVDQALDNVEGLAPARAAYRDASRGIEAVDAGEQFMGSSPDTVAAAMRGAPESAQAPFRAAAARSIERAAGSTGAAPGVANRLAIPGTPQRQMMDETLGPDAERLALAMRGERDIYRGAQQVDPGVGSQTANNAMKAGEAAGAAGDLLAGRPLNAVRRVVGLLDSRGFNPQQAEALLAAMTDPKRTDEVIGLLSERMSRREARNLSRQLRYQLTIAPQSGQPQ